MLPVISVPQLLLAVSTELRPLHTHLLSSIPQWQCRDPSLRSGRQHKDDKIKKGSALLLAQLLACARMISVNKISSRHALLPLRLHLEKFNRRAFSASDH